ncbi:MAG: DMT family transporter [Gordonia sp. (in: high G+C Gram-positive bacteria)]|uniref:DMT family transporter n=1 Tax=Gordonia sp. (in: high G+C Gram-positive bacteria) TaxID=84139 RepID=UPI003C752EFF
MHTWAPILFAIAAAVLIAAGTVLRQRSSAASGAITPGWWLGAFIALMGFSLQATALALGSILVVQPLLVLAVLFALPMENWIDKRHLLKSEWLWGTSLVVGVVLFLLLARPVSTDRRPDMLSMVITVTVLVVGIIGIVVAAERCQSGHLRALSYGLAAGALFGVSAPLVKAVAFRMIDAPGTLFTHVELYLLLAVVLLAIIAQQRGFGAGDLQTSFPAMNVMEPAVAMALGVALLGENIYVTVPTAAFLCIVAVVASIAVVKLAQDSAISSERPLHDREAAVELS